MLASNRERAKKFFGRAVASLGATCRYLAQSGQFSGPFHHLFGAARRSSGAVLQLCGPPIALSGAVLQLCGPQLSRTAPLSRFSVPQMARTAPLGRFAAPEKRRKRAHSRAQERGYSPIRSRRFAIAYSRFSFAMKLTLISAGQTASHS